MDVNGTQFHLLLGYNDWSHCWQDEKGEQSFRMQWNAPTSSSNTGSAWNHEQNALTLRPYLNWNADTDALAFQLSDRRGAARDRSHNWYWIDQSRREILIQPPGITNALHFWSTDNDLAYATTANSGDVVSQVEEQAMPSPALLSGLAITDDSYLVVGVLEPAGLLIFNLFAATLPIYLLWPPAVPFAPFDVAPRPGGGVWILDRDHTRYWALDRHFHVLRHDQPELLLLSEQIEIFQSALVSEESVSVQHFPDGFALFTDGSESSDTPPSAVAIEALPDGTVLILAQAPGEPFASIYRYRLHHQQGKPVSTKTMSLLIEQQQLASFQLQGYDFAFVPQHNDGDQDTQSDRLYVITPQGRQVYAFNIWQQHNQLTIQPLSGFYPTHLFTGKTLAVADHELFYDSGNSWLTLIEQRSRYTTDAMLYTPLGTTYPTLDGTLPGCVWHRLLLDAAIPPETTVQIWSRASDTEEDLLETTWLREPDLYQRADGSELPFVETPRGEGTWELLFQAARGRYLQLKIMLAGSGNATPSLRAMRIYYPRFSYLTHYLPAVYSQNSHSASFLERFLANVEGFYTSIEGRIAAAQMLFDPRSTPAEALAWLASWIGASLDINWDIPKQRFFLRHAMEYFQCRGTLRGLQMILQLTFDTHPGGLAENSFDAYLKRNTRINGIRIVEKFRTRQAPGALFGDPTDPNGEPLSQERWTPDSGSHALIARYRQQLQQAGIDADTLKTITSFPLTQPADATQELAWLQVAHDVLGFVPTMTQHPHRWQRFLRRRYITVAALNHAYQDNFSTFEDVSPFQNLPPDGQPLQDWYQFETIVLATYNVAHQFTVLLPMPTTGNPQSHYRQLELAARIIEKEKPAHTVFEVKFYRAAFAVGAARLGMDTFVDLGSRTPDLIAPLILGESYISESYLTTEQLYALAHQRGASIGETDEQYI